MKIKRQVIQLFLFILFTLLSIDLVNAQNKDSTEKRSVAKSTVHEGDTIPMLDLKAVSIYPPLEFESKREKRKYDRLHRYVVKVYPYAEVAGEMLRYFDDTLKSFKTEYARKRYLKRVEEQLKAEFGGELKKLTIMQGIILVKLIDRETGNTSYELIKQLRGSFSAFLWQSLARLFGSNLKLEYDPDGDDYLIEDIVLRIESGQIPYEKRERNL
ncbi:MAG: DUF4294 domain-containing protein [Vicingaceae bacterium]